MYFFLAIEFVYLVYLLFTRTEIISNRDKTIQIKQHGQQDIILQLPLEINNWWNYFQVKDLPIRSMSGKSYNVRHSRVNIVMSFVEITDANNQKINFVEKIVYGTRFPNESQYIQKPLDSNEPTFKIDRTDKLFDFIIDCTYPKS